MNDSNVVHGFSHLLSTNSMIYVMKTNHFTLKYVLASSHPLGLRGDPSL